MSMSLTVGLIIGQLILLGLCYWKDRQPVDPLRPRLLPYRLIMLVLVVAFLGTAAHLVSLLTGNPVVPRRGKMG
jgi:uncharacterized iron-regulated membrane protein